MSVLKPAGDKFMTAKNGYGGDVKFLEKKVCFKNRAGTSLKLGNKLNKESYVKQYLMDQNDWENGVKQLLSDWQLYDNAWVVKTGTPLFNYLCQSGTTSKPPFYDKISKQKVSSKYTLW